MAFDRADIYVRSREGEFWQGEIVSDLVEIQWNGLETQVTLIEHPLAIILSADCDLTQDHNAREAASPAPEKLLRNVFFCDVMTSDELKASGGVNSTLFASIKNNKNERYQYLAEVPADKDLQGVGFGSCLGMDFKQFFCVSTDHLLKQLRPEGRAKRRCRLEYPFAQHLAQRFFSFHVRVGLPVDHEPLVRKSVRFQPTALEPLPHAPSHRYSRRGRTHGPAVDCAGQCRCAASNRGGAGKREPPQAGQRRGHAGRRGAAGRSAGGGVRRADRRDDRLFRAAGDRGNRGGLRGAAGAAGRGDHGAGGLQQAAIRRAAETIPLLWAPSMSLAVNLAMKLAEVAGRVLKDHPSGADVEIIEQHHRFKEDAPSGTALKFGAIIASAMGQSEQRHGRSGRPGARPHGEIGYHAVRTGDNPGEHTIIFGLLGETLEIRSAPATATATPTVRWPPRNSWPASRRGCTGWMACWDCERRREAEAEAVGRKGNRLGRAHGNGGEPLADCLFVPFQASFFPTSSLQPPASRLSPHGQMRRRLSVRRCGGDVEDHR